MIVEGPEKTNQRWGKVSCIIFLFAFIFCIMVSLVYGQVMTEQELRNTLNNTIKNTQGSAKIVGKQILRSFWNENNLKTILLNGIITGFVEDYDYEDYKDCGTNVIFNDYQLSLRMEDEWWQGELGRASVPDTLNIVTLKSTNENSKLNYFLAVKDDDLLFTLRKGDEVSVEFKFTGITFQLMPDGYRYDTYGILTAHAKETKILKCEEGHEYPYTTGYKFCPKCGKPLK